MLLVVHDAPLPSSPLLCYARTTPTPLRSRLRPQLVGAFVPPVLQPRQAAAARCLWVGSTSCMPWDEKMKLGWPRAASKHIPVMIHIYTHGSIRPTDRPPLHHGTDSAPTQARSVEIEDTARQARASTHVQRCCLKLEGVPPARPPAAFCLSSLVCVQKAKQRPPLTDRPIGSRL